MNCFSVEKFEEIGIDTTRLIKKTEKSIIDPLVIDKEMSGYIVYNLNEKTVVLCILNYKTGDKFSY